MEVFLGGMVILAWFALVIWGAANLVVQAKRKNDWEKVGIAALSATTVAGPLAPSSARRRRLGPGCVRSSRANSSEAAPKAPFLVG
jgi:hypothetical protein